VLDDTLTKNSTLSTNSQTKSLWDNIAKYYDDKIDEGEKEVAKELEKILQTIGVSEGSLLEAGCGSGQISALLVNSGYDVALLDFSEVALEKSKKIFEQKNIKGNFILSDLFEMSPEKTGTYDVVWNSGVLEHYDGWQIINALEKMSKVAKKFVIFLIPNPKSKPYMAFRKKALENNSWQWGLEILRENLDDLATYAGLEVISQHYIGTSHIKYFENYLEHDSSESEKISDENKYLKVVVAKPISVKLNDEEKIKLLTKILKNDSAVLRDTYYLDTSILVEQSKHDKATSAHLYNELNETKNELNSKINKLNQKLSNEKETSIRLKNDLNSLNRQLSFEKDRIELLLNSKTWKLTRLYEKKLGGTILGKLIEKIIDLMIKNTSTITEKESKKNLNVVDQKQEQKKVFKQITEILDNNPDVKGIIIYPPTVDWNIPLLQRPQHMALNLAKNNWLYFYCTTNTYDKISGFKKLSDRLYLTDKYEELLQTLDEYVIFIHSGHPSFEVDDIVALEKKGTIVYDYLDEIHPSVSGIKSKDVHARHQYLVKNSRAVLVTAKKLFNEVKQLRKDEIYLLPNAVEYSHFHRKPDPQNIPKEIKSIKDNGGPIIGYFGAIANWFDYDLIIHMAKTNPTWNIVLIGWDYDDSLDKSGIKQLKNVYFLGIKKYSVLPNYASWFDVCILPFLLNDITHATSPIKLFEYMALGKPIVTTAISEASNYKSCLIANSKDDFIKKIHEALKLNENSQYISLLDKEAQENTWEKRFSNVDKILQNFNIKKQEQQKIQH